MRPRAALLIASILIALVATGLLALYVRGADERAQQQAFGAGMTPILVVTREVPPGTALDEVHFARRAFAGGSIPPDVVTDLSQLSGQVTTSTLFAGMPLVRGMFTAAGATRGAEVELTGVAPDRVVVAVRVSGLDTLDDALSPGGVVTLFNTVDGRTTVLVPRIPVVRVVRSGTADGRVDALLVSATPPEAALITAANRSQTVDVGIPGSKAPLTNVTANLPGGAEVRR